MYKVYFEDTFFKWLDHFVLSMKNHYYYFYSNTGLYDEEKIVTSYFELYEQLKTDILNKIQSLSEDWILWRKTFLKRWDIENCYFTFRMRSYNVTFSAMKDDDKKEVIVYDLKVEV